MNGKSGVLHGAMGSAIALGFALAACSGERDLNEEHVAVSSSALATADYTDASGQVKIRIKTCDYPAQATSGPHCAYCAVDSGWVRIGGGGEIEGSPSNARLRASLPSNDPAPHPNCTGNGSGDSQSTWVARSDGTSAHRLRAYVIGLQVTGMTAADLSLHVYTNEATTANDGPLNQTLDVPALQGTLIGGGAEMVPPAFYTDALPAGGNGYLTESRPLDAGTWRAKAVFASPIVGAMKVYSIGIDQCLPVFGWPYCMDWKMRSVTVGPNTGYATASLATPYPWITTSNGARGVTNGGSSRYLADLIPFAGSEDGFTVTTKDQGTSVNATTVGYSINLLGGAEGYWRYNAIRFNTSGTTLSRPSGAAPVRLQQSTDYPGDAARHFHLEPFGNAGEYRVRNGNPQQGTECAYRDSVVAGNVLMGPCGTSNDFKWTKQFDPSGPTYKLRNVANGRCLDTNGAGYTNSDLVTRTCSSAYADAQSLVSEAFSWPP